MWVIRYLLLPDQDGISLIKEIRSFPILSELPILVLSVKADKWLDEIKGNTVAVIDWLDKPLDPKRLYDALQSIKKKFADKALRILHIEDDVDLARVVADLMSEDATITHVTTLKSARRELKDQAYDVVILDLVLPDGSGTKLLPQLGKASIPVIVFSAYELPLNCFQYVFKTLMKSKATHKDLLTAIHSAIHPKENYGKRFND